MQHCQLKTLALSAQAAASAPAQGDALQANETAAATAEGKPAAKSVAALAATKAATPVPKQAIFSRAGQRRQQGQGSYCQIARRRACSGPRVPLQPLFGVILLLGHSAKQRISQFAPTEQITH